MNAPKKIEKFLEDNADLSIECIKYEELIKNPAKTLQKLYQFIGLSYSSKILDINLNEQINGKYGDTNIKTKNYKKILNLRPETKRFSRWSNFFAGYLDFLGEDFMLKYGYVHDIRLKPTLVFKRYLKKVKKEELFLKNSIYNKFNSLSP